MPAGDSLRAVCQLIRLYVGPEFDFAVQPILRAACVPASRLGGAGRCADATRMEQLDPEPCARHRRGGGRLCRRRAARRQPGCTRWRCCIHLVRTPVGSWSEYSQNKGTGVVQVNLKQLVGRLNDTLRRTLEAAAGACLSRTNYNVEIEHWLLKILETSNTDLGAILRQFGVDQSRLTADLTRTVDRFKTGNARSPALSLNVIELIREAWLICSVDYGERAVRSGHLLCALLADESLARVAHAASKEFEQISLEALRQDLATLVASTDEAGQPLEPATAAAGEAPRPGGPSRTPSLDQFTIDLTDRARQGHIDPVLGRDAEIRQVIDILTRRRQNNPILTGEAGVGKTAVVEGFALRIVAGDVPAALQNVSLRTLDLGLLQAGAGVRGEFENRLKSVISEVKASATPIILFIDEAHTMIGAGGGSGQGDAANLLKPALARGELRTIAATTWSEYKEYFEKDAALTRRFQVVKVDEPEVKTAIAMMRGLVSTLEKHHGVRVLNEAVEDAVRLSSRYISGRQLPDKSVSLLDTTCARIGLSQTSTPPAIEDCRHRIEQLDVVIEILQRETRAGKQHDQQLVELEGQKKAALEEMEKLNQRWEQEQQLSTLVRELLAKIEEVPTGATDPPATGQPDAEALRTQLQAAENQLRDFAGRTPARVSVCHRPGGGRNRLRVDRHPAGTDGGQRNQDRPASQGAHGRVHHRPIARPGPDRQERPHVARQPAGSPHTRSACSCWRGRVVSARPKRPLPSPICSMAASRT